MEAYVQAFRRRENSELPQFDIRSSYVQTFSTLLHGRNRRSSRLQKRGNRGKVHQRESEELLIYYNLSPEQHVRSGPEDGWNLQDLRHHQNHHYQPSRDEIRNLEKKRSGWEKPKRVGIERTTAKCLKNWSRSWNGRWKWPQLKGLNYNNIYICVW